MTLAYDSDVSSASSEEVHPNIDERSFKKWKTEQKKMERKRKIQRIQEIEALPSTPELEEERLRLIEEIKPKIREVCPAQTTFGSEIKKELPKEKNDDEIDYSNELEFLINYNEVEDFIELLDNRPTLDINKFEEFVLFNLSANIKEGNDEAGVIISKISIYVKYAKEHGKTFLMTLMNSLNSSKERKNNFIKECKKHYLEAKEAILSLY
ncbi:hypothetical protein TCON_1154 [Astathelohania contejeani]|uniref:Cdc37 N-terminal domain-containing protein n=1 Tax=Astathelohania contejeani TaxID=164912 RepID=A0ABQ7HZK8_9MICR|nr:hypothetical protein TCON_1154 [Thelohania contejeani]